VTWFVAVTVVTLIHFPGVARRSQRELHWNWSSARAAARGCVV